MKNTMLVIALYGSMLLPDELQNLCKEGYGAIVTREKMVKDKVLPYNQCCTVYLKPGPDYVDRRLLKMANDEDITLTFYTANFNKQVTDVAMHKIISKYHPDLSTFYFTPMDDDSQQTASGK